MADKKVKVSDYVADYIASIGVKDVFMISGGGNMHLVDSVGKHKKLRYVCNHHEQASAIAAEGYARVTKNIGVCLVTTGPGGTNAITGIAGGWLDSIPMLCISGQIPSNQMITGTKLRQLGVQEINIVDIVRPITKYAVVITEPKEVRYHLEKAVFLAKSGRPGPVWLDIPLDVQGALIDPGEQKGFDPESEGLVLKLNDSELRILVGSVIEEIKKAKKPIMLVGHGIHLAHATNLFHMVARSLNIPVLTTMSAIDLLPYADPNFVGRPGIFGDRAGNFAVQNADLLISIGARMHLWNTGYNYKDFARNARKIVVDIDPAELEKKTIQHDVAIMADAKDFLSELQSQWKGVEKLDIGEWQKRCGEWKKKYPVTLPEYKAQRRYVNYYYFVDELSGALENNEILVTGDGTAFTATHQAFKTKKNQQIIFSVGCAAMGYDLPAVIGACFGNKKKRTVLITGDGSIMLNLQELQTVAHHKLPIKIFLINNGGYLAIRNTQNNYFNHRLVASDATSGVTFPSFKKIAGAFSLPYLAIHNNKGVVFGIAKTLKTPGPVICEIFMDPSQELNPRPKNIIHPDGTFTIPPLEDMYPFLDREEFKQNMR